MTEKQTKWLRLFFYILWCIITITTAILLLAVAIGTDTIENCENKVWNFGDIYNYPNGLPCTPEFYTAFYIFYIILYILFDYVRSKILNTNLSVRLTEIGVCFLAYWLYIAYDWSNSIVLLASFISSLRIFLPLFTMAILIGFIRGHYKQQKLN